MAHTLLIWDLFVEMLVDVEEQARFGEERRCGDADSLFGIRSWIPLDGRRVDAPAALGQAGQCGGGTHGFSASGGLSFRAACSQCR